MACAQLQLAPVNLTARSILSIAILQLILVLHGMQSYVHAADVSSIQEGELATVHTTNALGFMGGITMDKGKWLELGHSPAHPEAFLRFMVLGAPAAGVVPTSSWGPVEDSYVARKGGLLATRGASIAEFSSHHSNKDLGILDITAWMLAFACVDSISACTSLAPVAIANRVAETSGSTCIEFTIAWDKLVLGSSSLVTNTITAKLADVSKEERIVKQGAAGNQLDKFSINVLSRDMEACPSSTPMQVAVRSSLDATYNLGPYACYRIDSTTFKSIAMREHLLVVGMQYTNVASGSDDDQVVGGTASPQVIGYPGDPAQMQTSSTSCIQGVLQKYQKVSLAECQDSPLLMADNSDPPSFTACPNASSVTCLSVKLFNLETNSSCEDVVFQAFNTSVFDLAKTQRTTQFQAMNMTGFNYISGSSSYGLPTGNLCEIAGNIQNGRQSGANLTHPFGYSNNPLAVDVDTLGGLFVGLDNEYAQAHSDTLQLERGASTDFFTATVALVGAAISVVTATIPVTNFLLRLLIKVSGSLDGSSSRYPKIALICMVNVLLAFLSYGIAVVGMIVSEKEHAKEFKTWAVIAESVVVNEMGLQLQALYVVQGLSVYKSRLLILIWSLLSILVVLVGGMTYQRCRTVLKRLQLIKTSNLAMTASHSLGHEAMLLDEYSAIEMGTVEYMQL